MTDPVDTDALRETALDLEPVRADERISNTQWARVHIAKRALFAAADEVDRLRAVIENAPHEELCMTNIPAEKGPYCNCWKAGTL